MGEARSVQSVLFRRFIAADDAPRDLSCVGLPLPRSVTVGTAGGVRQLPAPRSPQTPRLLGRTPTLPVNPPEPGSRGALSGAEQRCAAAPGRVLLACVCPAPSCGACAR